MRRLLLAAAAAAMVAGCASIFQGMYDDAAREDCDNNTSAGERGECYDRVDQNSRDRDWE